MTYVSSGECRLCHQNRPMLLNQVCQVCIQKSWQIKRRWDQLTSRHEKYRLVLRDRRALRAEIEDLRSRLAASEALRNTMEKIGAAPKQGEA